MTKAKQNILVLTSEFPPLPGGIGNHAYNLAEFLQRDTYNVTVLADQRGGVTEENEFDKNLSFRVIRIKKRRFRGSMYLQRIIKFYKEKRNVELVICSGKFPLWLGAVSNLFSKKQHLAIIHGTEVNFTKTFLKRSINAALTKFNKVVAVSEYTKRLVKNLPLKQLQVIPNGYNEEKWRIEEETALDLVGHPKLLTVGNVTERKGQANVINHLPEALKEFPELHYHCVGLNTEVKAFKKRAVSLGVDAHVTFHGRVSHKELKGFYQNADICLMLSNETSSGDVEGFGIALIEANHFGVPAIGALGCGIEDAIAQDESGLLIDAMDTKAFVDAIKQIEANKRRFKHGAQAWAEQHQWSVIIKKYITLIEA